MRSVPVPPALQQAPQSLLEEYVQARLSSFVDLMVERLFHHEPTLNPMSVQRSITDALAFIPPYNPAPAPVLVPPSEPQQQYQLVFRHDCMALGCLDPQCSLCQHNPHRRCTVNFDRKYLVNDLLKARCSATIRLELIDRATGKLVDQDIHGLRLEVCVLDGHAYNTKFVDGGRVVEGGCEADEELDECSLLLNKKKNTPLLVSAAMATNDNTGKLILQLQHGRSVLPDISITDSSEAILLGRKPPFRLLVRANWQALTGGSGRVGPAHVRIRHAISEPFVVATRRTRTAGKVDIPSVEDPVSKLEHMGKETVKKLSDIASAALQAGFHISIPENCVTKVGEFKQLALRAEQDSHLRQRLQHVLKLSKEKWDEAREHAMRAVVSDGRMRAWYVSPNTCDLGLLYNCRMGSVDLERPVALIQVTTSEGGTMRSGGGGGPEAPAGIPEAIPVAQLTPAQRELFKNLRDQARHCWWHANHPGWSIYSDAGFSEGAPVGTPGVTPTAAAAMEHSGDLSMQQGPGSHSGHTLSASYPHASSPPPPSAPPALIVPGVSMVAGPPGGVGAAAGVGGGAGPHNGQRTMMSGPQPLMGAHSGGSAGVVHSTQQHHQQAPVYPGMPIPQGAGMGPASGSGYSSRSQQGPITHHMVLPPPAGLRPLNPFGDIAGSGPGSRQATPAVATPTAAAGLTPTAAGVAAGNTAAAMAAALAAAVAHTSSPSHSGRLASLTGSGPQKRTATDMLTSNLGPGGGGGGGFNAGASEGASRPRSTFSTSGLNTPTPNSPQAATHQPAAVRSTSAAGPSSHHTLPPPPLAVGPASAPGIGTHSSSPPPQHMPMLTSPRDAPNPFASITAAHHVVGGEQGLQRQATGNGDVTSTPTFDISALPSLPYHSLLQQQQQQQGGPGVMGPPQHTPARISGGGAAAQGLAAALQQHQGPGFASAAAALRDLPSAGVGSFLASVDLEAVLGTLGQPSVGNDMETSLGLGASLHLTASNLAAYLEQNGSAGGAVWGGAAGGLPFQGVPAGGHGYVGPAGGPVPLGGGGMEPGLNTVTSGLDNMQSIEQALPNLDADDTSRFMAAAAQASARVGNGSSGQGC